METYEFVNPRTGMVENEPLIHDNLTDTELDQIRRKPYAFASGEINIL